MALQAAYVTPSSYLRRASHRREILRSNSRDVDVSVERGSDGCFLHDAR